MTELEPGLAECPQLKMLRIEGSIYFGAVNHVDTHFDTLRETNPNQKHLLLLAKSINFVDVAGAELLAHEAERRRKSGGQLYFYSMRQPVQDMLERGGFMEHIGRENIFVRRYDAISGVFARLDRSICSTCRARIFNECATLPPPRT
jgi:SulP family sulfate permease